MELLTHRLVDLWETLRQVFASTYAHFENKSERKECPVCYEEICKTGLNCQVCKGEVCRECLQKMVESGRTLACPLCRAPC